MSALRRVLGGGEVAQSRMAVPAVVLFLEIAPRRRSHGNSGWRKRRRCEAVTDGDGHQPQLVDVELVDMTQY